MQKEGKMAELSKKWSKLWNTVKSVQSGEKV